jgi:hypothetical protein
MTISTHPFPLGRIRDEETDRAEELYPFTAPTPERVERILSVPGWRPSHDQGREGSCVGHAVAIERAITNRAELVTTGVRRTVRYDPISLWRAAKGIDQWSFTKPEDDNGTSVRAAYEIARTRGLVHVRTMRVENGRPIPILTSDGAEWDPRARVAEYRWARTVDAIRAAIAGGVPVAIGVDWYSGFDSPIARGREAWLPDPSSAGRVRGGHSVTLYGASDRREAFRLVNSWGRAYPLVWIPYATMELLLAKRGEAALVTDHVEPVTP